MESFFHLGIALALGLLIGTERGWQLRGRAEGSRIAGIRTFGLFGLLGGLWALLAETLGALLLGFAFLGLAAVLIVAHALDERVDRDAGITTVVAGLVTFALGAYAVRGDPALAAAMAVATTVLLSLKPTLHHWLQYLTEEDLRAALKLLLISVVMLPILPDQGYGPWQALNPYHIWWMVVLIAGLSFAGYVAMRIVGPRRGILLTGLLGGLVSSTAITLNFSRMARRLDLGRLLSAGALVASATMFPRVMLEVAVINPGLLPRVLPPLGLMGLVATLYSLWLWRRVKNQAPSDEIHLQNPLALKSAVQFGLLLSLILVLAEGFRAWLGNPGIYLLALLSGIADVDAITLSLSHLAEGGLSANVAARGIVFATISNTLMKGLLVVFIAPRRMLPSYAPGLLLTLAAGGLSLLLVAEGA